MNHYLFLTGLVLVGGSITVAVLTFLARMWSDPDLNFAVKCFVTVFGGGMYCLIMAFFVESWGRG